MANIHRTPEQWQKIFTEHASSGMHIADFCKQQKLNTSSFYAWRKRLASNKSHAVITDASPLGGTQNDWVNIVPEQKSSTPLPPKHWDIELALPNGIILRMNNS